MRLSCLVNLILRVGDIELITKNLQPFLCGLISSNFSGKKNGYGETKMRNSACLKERCNLSLLVLLYHKNLLESKTTLNKVPAVLLRRIILLLYLNYPCLCLAFCDRDENGNGPTF